MMADCICMFPGQTCSNPACATTPEQSPDAVEQLRAEAETQLAMEVARHAGDRVFDLVKTHACTLPTVTAAIGLGMLIAQQVVAETIEFAVNSMDGDKEDEAAIRTAAETLAAQIVVPALTRPTVTEDAGKVLALLARIADRYDRSAFDSLRNKHDGFSVSVSLGTCRRARAALSSDRGVVR